MDIKIIKQYHSGYMKCPTKLFSVELDGRHVAYVVANISDEKTDWESGAYFVGIGTASRYFDLYMQYHYSDVELTQLEETEFTGIHPRTYKEMEAYING